MEINHLPYILEQGCCCLILLPIFVFIMHCILKRNKPRINIENVVEVLSGNDILFLSIKTTIDSLTYIFQCSDYIVKFICYRDLPIKYIKITSLVERGELSLKYRDGAIVEHNFILVSRMSKSFLALNAYHEIYILVNKQVLKIKSV